MSKDTKGDLMVTINPNHIDLDLLCPIGWSNNQTHILHIKLHLHLPIVQLLSFLAYVMTDNIMSDSHPQGYKLNTRLTV